MLSFLFNYFYLTNLALFILYLSLYHFFIYNTLVIYILRNKVATKFLN